MPINYITRKMQ